MPTRHAESHPGGLDRNGCHQEQKANQNHCHPERLARGKLETCSLETPPKAGDEGVFFEPFVRVKDGDTFEAKVQGVVMDFRLAAADAPEHDQPYGNEATRALDPFLHGKQLVLVPTDTDRYGRTIAFVWVGSQCINEEMVERGAAWFNAEYSNDAQLYETENAARDAKRGLWALPVKQRVEPWVWREAKR